MLVSNADFIGDGTVLFVVRRAAGERRGTPNFAPEFQLLQELYYEVQSDKLQVCLV